MSPPLSGFLQRQRFKAISPYLCGDVLDLGCSDARSLRLLRRDQAYVGIERHPAQVDWLKEHHRDYEFHRRDLDKDELAPGRQFDTILMVAVIEHLENPDRILSQIPFYLSPGGKLVITTPSPLGDKIHRIGSRVGLFHMDAVRDHKSIYTYPKLEARLERNGLRVVRYRSFLLGGNQLFVCEARQQQDRT